MLSGKIPETVNGLAFKNTFSQLCLFHREVGAWSSLHCLSHVERHPFYFQVICVFTLKVSDLYTVYDWVLDFLFSLCLLIGMFRPLIFNVITDMIVYLPS